MPPKKADAQSPALQQLPNKTTVRLPAKPAAQPARPLSQRYPPPLPPGGLHSSGRVGDVCSRGWVISGAQGIAGLKPTAVFNSSIALPIRVQHTSLKSPWTAQTGNPQLP